MAETVLNDSPPAPAITPVSPTDCRRPRAAECHARRLSPTAGDAASQTKPRPPFECIALLLQRGGALGAYQAKIYGALVEADLHSDRIAVISIDAINGALLAGNVPEGRVNSWVRFGSASPPNRIVTGEHLYPAKSVLLGAAFNWRLSWHRLQGETHA